MANASRDLAVNLVGRTDKLNKAFGNLGGKLSGKAKAGLVGLALAAVAALKEGFAGALNAEQLTANLRASLGLTGVEAKAAGEIASRLYRDAWGDSLDETTAAVGAMISSFDGLAGDELETLTAQAIAFSDVFGTDVTKAVTTAGVLLKSGLVDDAQEAFDLMTVGMQEMPAGLRDELMDATNEYSQFFAALGIDGEEAFGLLVKASEDGQFGVDKMGDALKELSIRSTDMSKASVNAYEAAGLSAEDMSNRFLAGGETANEAFDELVAGLLSIEDPTEQANAAIALFGTPLEDLGTHEIPQFLEGLTSMESSLGNVDGAAREMANTVGTTTSAKLTAFRRKVMGKLADAAVIVIEKFEEWVPKIRDVVGKVVDFFKRFADPGELLGDLGSVLLDKGKDLLRGLRDGARDFWDDTVLPWLKDLPSRAVAGIGALGSLLLGKGKDLLRGLRDGAAEVWGGLKDWLASRGTQALLAVPSLLETLKSRGRQLLNGLRDGAEEVWEKVKTWLGDRATDALLAVPSMLKTLESRGKQLLNGLRNGAEGVWDGFKDWLGDRASEALLAVPGMLGTLRVRGAQLLRGLRNGAMVVWVSFRKWLASRGTQALLAVPSLLETLKSRGRQLLNGLRDGAEARWEKLKEWLGDLKENIKNAIPDLGAALVSAGRSLVGGLIEGIGQRGQEVVNKILSLIPSPLRSFVSGLLGIGGGSSGSGTPFNPNIAGRSGGLGGGHTPIKVHGGGRVVPGSPNDELLALLQGGETVRTARQERELAAMMASGRGGGGGPHVTNHVTINMPPGSNGDDVVRALRQWERRRGPIPISVR